MAGVDGLGRLEADAAILRARMVTLTRQLSTGQRAERLSEIAPQLARALDLKADIARRDAYTAGIGRALDRAGAAQTTLARIGDIASEFADQVAITLDPNDPDALPAIAQRARTALVELGHLLNTRHNGEYLFGGSDVANPPVPDPDGLPTSGFAVQIGAAVAGLTGAGAVATAAATRAAVLDDSPGVSPFAAFAVDPATGAAEPRRGVLAEDGQLVGYGLFAARNAGANSIGETTGGWARDLLRGLASLAALTDASTTDPAAFGAFAVTIREGLKSASEAIGAEAGALGLTEARLADTRDRHGDIQIALRSQLAEIEEVDLAEALTRLQATQTILEASYTAIGRIGALTLTSFLR